MSSVKIETWQTWSKRTGEKCRTFSHWENGFRYFRIRTRDRILLDAGYKCLPDTVTITTNERDEKGRVIRLKPKDAVRDEIAEYLSSLADGTDVEAVYFADTMNYGHYFVYRKFVESAPEAMKEEG